MKASTETTIRSQIKNYKFNFGNLKTKLSARKDDIQYIELIKLRDELYRRIER
jgi:hypothetical protein